MASNYFIHLDNTQDRLPFPNIYRHYHSKYNNRMAILFSWMGYDMLDYAISS